MSDQASSRSYVNDMIKFLASFEQKPSSSSLNTFLDRMSRLLRITYKDEDADQVVLGCHTYVLASVYEQYAHIIFNPGPEHLRRLSNLLKSKVSTCTIDSPVLQFQTSRFPTSRPNEYLTKMTTRCLALVR